MRITVYLFFGALLLLIQSCGESVNDPTVDKPIKIVKGNSKAQEPDTILKTEEFKNGVKINWLVAGSGELVEVGNVIDLDYKVTLEDNSLVESSRSRGMSSIPFMVGYGMQTEGWDYAFGKMKAGDSAVIFLPAKLARGEVGYRERDRETGKVVELIPPNANLILTVKVRSIMEPTRTIDGTNVWVLFEKSSGGVEFSEESIIDFHCTASTASNASFINTFNNKPPYSMKITDNGIVPGLKKSMLGAKSGDRMYILVPSSQAYKGKGLQDLVKPNEDVFYNALVMDVRKITK